MRAAGLLGTAVGCAILAASAITVHREVRAAGERLRTGATMEKPAVAVANDAEAAYCTPAFKQVLARVIHACGLVGGEARRGCQPADVKTLASISDEDFNALFTPLKSRGAVLLFDDAKSDLDDQAKKIVEERWNDRGGARYFFVVARASKTGAADYNRKLSHLRANSVLFHITDKFKDKDADIDKEAGMLWLGSEFAQLGKEYCDWNLSRPGKCSAEAINRSAFISWVDCQL